jgi:prolipoprotein diacylglyceryl transferase
MLPAIITGFIGARLYHVASEPQRYWNTPADIVKVWNGGLGIYGGLLIGGITAWLLSRHYNFSLSALADGMAVGLPVGQAIGRWGNWFNQELFGRPTDLPWCVEIDRVHRPINLIGHPCYHPTFLYESLGCLAVAGTILYLHRRWKSRTPGVLFCAYLIAYSIVRFFVEGIRIDNAHEWMGLRQNEWVAIAVAVGSFLVAVILIKREQTIASPTDSNSTS